MLKISIDLPLGLCPGSRSAHFVYFAYCTAQKKWICHISQNFEEEAWAKEMKGRRVWWSEKVWPYSSLFLSKVLVLVEPIPFLRWSREVTFPANLNGPLCYETCPGVQYIHIDTHLNKVKKKNLWISVGRKLEVHEADPHHTDQKFSEDDDDWDTFSVSTPIRTIRNTDPHACQQRHEIKSCWPVPILE